MRAAESPCACVCMPLAPETRASTEDHRICAYMCMFVVRAPQVPGALYRVVLGERPGFWVYRPAAFSKNFVIKKLRAFLFVLNAGNQVCVVCACVCVLRVCVACCACTGQPRIGGGGATSLTPGALCAVRLVCWCEVTLRAQASPIVEKSTRKRTRHTRSEPSLDTHCDKKGGRWNGGDYTHI